MYPESKYAPLLGAIATSGPHIQLIALTDLAGTLKGMINQPTLSKPTPTITDIHIFLGWAIAQSFKQIGHYFAFNDLHTVTIEYQRGILLLTPISNGVLIVLADPGASIEFIRQRITVIANELSKLEAALEVPPSVDEISSELDAKQFSTPLVDKEHSLMENKGLVDNKRRIKHALETLDSF